MASSRCCEGPIERQGSCCRGTDRAVVNGQTERQITCLKLVERQIFGCAIIDLLEALLIGVG